MKTKKKQGRPSTFKTRYYIEVYRLAAAGQTRRDIAATLGINFETLQLWCKKKKTLRWAYYEGRNPKGRTTVDNIMDYVAGRLPKEQLDLYNEIRRFNKDEEGYERVRQLLEGKGDTVKQHLFLHAYVSSNFDKTRAMRQICITTKTLSRWMQNPHFTELFKSIDDAMDDFYLGSLNKAIKDGDTQAIIHAAKTRLRKRGFGEKMEVSHVHEGTITHAFQLDFTKLSLRAQKEVMAQMEEQDRKTEQLEEKTISNGQQLLMSPKKEKN